MYITTGVSHLIFNTTVTLSIIRTLNYDIVISCNDENSLSCNSYNTHQRRINKEMIVRIHLHHRRIQTVSPWNQTDPEEQKVEHPGGTL